MIHSAPILVRLYTAAAFLHVLWRFQFLNYVVMCVRRNCSLSWDYLRRMSARRAALSSNETSTWAALRSPEELSQNDVRRDIRNVSIRSRSHQLTESEECSPFAVYARHCTRSQSGARRRDRSASSKFSTNQNELTEAEAC